MVASAARADWQHSQDALRDEIARTTALLRSIQDPGAPAVGQWSLGELAMHLSQVWMVVPGLARRDLSRFYEVVPSIAGVAGDSLIRDMWELADTTKLGVQSDPERDLGVLADRIEARAEEYFSECVGTDSDELRPWLVEGTNVDLSTLTCHLLSETVIHTYDIAQAAGRTWRIEPAHAAIALERFIVPLLQATGPQTFVNSAKASGLQATYGVRIRGGGSFGISFDDGKLNVVEPATRRVDCHLSADPVAFLMVVFNRQSQWTAIAQGKLIAWGRKPWLGFQLRGLLRNP